MQKVNNEYVYIINQYNFNQDSNNILNWNIYKDIMEARALTYFSTKELILFYREKREQFSGEYNPTLKRFYREDLKLENTDVPLINNFFVTLAGDEIIIRDNILLTCLKAKKILLIGAGYNIESTTDNNDNVDFIKDWIDTNNFEDTVNKIIDIKHIDGQCILALRKNSQINHGNYFLEILDILDIEIIDNCGFIEKIIYKKRYCDIEINDKKYKELLYKEIFTENYKQINYEFYIKNNDKWELVIDNQIFLQYFGLEEDYYKSEVPLIYIIKNDYNSNYKHFGLSSVTPVISEIIAKIEVNSGCQLAARESKAFLAKPKGWEILDLKGQPINKQHKTVQANNLDIADPEFIDQPDSVKQRIMESANKVEFFQPNYNIKNYLDLDRQYSLSIASNFNVPAHYLNIDSRGTIGEGILNEKERLGKIARQNEARKLAKFINNILNSILYLNEKDKIILEFNDIDELTYIQKLEIAEKIEARAGKKEALLFLYDNDEEKVNEIIEQIQVRIPDILDKEIIDDEEIE